MNPDFIISEKHTADGSIYVVLPTHMSARDWLFARAEESEKRNLSVHLVLARFEKFKSEAAAEDMSFKHSFSVGEKEQ